MRILACFTDPRLGGPGKRSIAVAERLKERGIRVDFLIPEGGDSFANAAKSAGCSVRRIDVPRIRAPRRIKENTAFFVTFNRKVNHISSAIKSGNYDVVHVNTPYNFQPARAAAQSDSALLWHFNDMLTPWPINSIAGKLANRWADGVAISCNQVSEYFGINNQLTEVLYPPVDLSEYTPDNYPHAREQLCEEFGIDSDAEIIGTVGNINPIKGYDTLISAFSRVVDERQDAELVIVGSELDSQRKYFERICSMIDSKNLQESVHFAGWRSDIPRLFSGFDVSVVASYSETGPLVALESMAMRCPLVSTAVGAVDECAIDGEHGWIVSPRDAAALAGGIISALGSPTERERRAESARQLIEERFSLESIADDHVRFYRRLT